MNLKLSDVRLDLPGKRCRCSVLGSLRTKEPLPVEEGDTIRILDVPFPCELRVERVEGDSLIVSR